MKLSFHNLEKHTEYRLKINICMHVFVYMYKSYQSSIRPKPVELQNGKGGMHKLQRMCKGDGGEGESGLRDQENQSQHNIKPLQASTSVLR